LGIGVLNVNLITGLHAMRSNGHLLGMLNALMMLGKEILTKNKVHLLNQNTGLSSGNFGEKCLRASTRSLSHFNEKVFICLCDKSTNKICQKGRNTPPCITA
jgi:hypothetical protein